MLDAAEKTPPADLPRDPSATYTAAAPSKFLEEHPLQEGVASATLSRWTVGGQGGATPPRAEATLSAGPGAIPFPTPSPAERRELRPSDATVTQSGFAASPKADATAGPAAIPFSTPGPAERRELRPSDATVTNSGLAGPSIEASAGPAAIPFPTPRHGSSKKGVRSDATVTRGGMGPASDRASNRTSDKASDSGSARGASLPTGGPTLPAPDEIPAYELLRVVGRGGCGEIWEARQSSLDRIVAVKRIREDALREANARERYRLRLEFAQEAVTTARLDHPNIVPVHDLGAGASGEPLLAMRLVRGRPWDDLLREDFPKLAPAEFLAKHLPILIGATQAVAFAHSRGIVHRDLKPSQVMTGEFGEVQLMDWGLAVFAGSKTPGAAHSIPLATGAGPRSLGAPPLETASSPSGTPALMAPEQTESTARRVGPWTDVYLLGGTLYYLLTGVYPHQADTAREAFQKAVKGEVEPPAQRAPDREPPAELAELAMKALERDPAQRLGSARELVERLQDYLSGSTRRRESEQLARDARAQMEKLDAERSTLTPRDIYARREAIGDLLGRALRLWGDNADALRSQARNLAGRVEEEIAQDDLLLAELHLDALRKSPDLAEEVGAPVLAAKLAEAFRRRDRARRQKKILTGTAIALGVFVLGLGWFANVQSSRAALAEVQTERAWENAREQESLKLLFERANHLRKEESELAAEFSRRAPLPETLDADPAEAPPLSGDELERLLGRRDQLIVERERLKKQGVPLEDSPYELLLAEANLRLARSLDEESLRFAYGLYESAAKARPDLPEPLMGMGAAAYRAGSPTSATASLDRAVDLALKLRGESHPSYAQALALAGEAYQEMDDSAEAYQKYFEKSLAILEPQWTRMSFVLADHLNRLGRYQEAENYASPALPLTAKLFGNRSPQYALALEEIAWHRRRLGFSADSEKLAREALSIWREGLEPNELKAGTMLDFLGTTLVDLGRYNEAEPLLLETLAIYERELPPHSARISDILYNLGHLRYVLDQRPEAEELLRRSLALVREIKGPDHPEAAIVLETLADVASEDGRLDDALALQDEGLALREKTLGSNHPDTATAYSSKGQMLVSAGRHAEAEPLYLRALEVYEKTLAPDHPYFATLVGNLGSLYRDQGRYDEAETLYHRCLAAQEGRLGPDHPAVAGTLNGLAVLYGDMERHEEAATALERAIAIREKIFGPDHIDHASPLANLATLKSELGEFEEAQALYERVLAIRERSQGPDHYSVASTLNNYGALLQKMDRYAEAQPLHERALAIGEKVFDPDNIELIPALNNLGVVHHARGERDQAAGYYRRAAGIIEKSMGPNHPKLITLLGNIASIETEKENYAEAEALFQRALAIAEKTFGPDHPAIAAALNNMAFIDVERKRYPEAEALFRRALTIWEGTFGDETPQSGFFLANMAGMMERQGRLDEALEAFERALAIREATLPPDHADLANNLYLLARLRTHRGELDQAEEIFRRELALRESRVAAQPDDPGRWGDISDTVSQLAKLALQRGRLEEAEAFAARALETARPDFEAEPSDKDKRVAWAHRHLWAGEVAAALGRTEEARAAWESALAIASPPDGEKDAEEFREVRSRALIALGRVEEGETLAQELLASGCDDWEFFAFCRERGLLPPLLEPARQSLDAPSLPDSPTPASDPTQSEQKEASAEEASAASASAQE
jgi:tetratricopeptide (TPR) repeat protein/serine/threonine protein kinase